MIRIARVVGRAEVLEYIDKFHLKCDKDIEEKLQNFKKKPWDKFINSSNSRFHAGKTDALYDLLS